MTVESRESLAHLLQTIGNDAPIVLAKACEFFVAELSCHSWVHAGKRVTLQVRKRAPRSSASPPRTLLIFQRLRADR